MAKNIILLSDGTGNSARKLFKTNVWRLYQALDLADPPSPDRPNQVAYYDDGVGTASLKPLAILGGAFGWGTKRNVLDLYTFLCRHYKPGDSIYGFGFSRGAFTMRMLTGFIAARGLVEAKTETELRQFAADAFRTYREEKYKRKTLVTWLFRRLRNLILFIWYKISRKNSHYRKNKGPIPKIKFLGLWDTVAAYGLPIDEFTHAWDFLFPLSFPERNLSDIIDSAYHAVAIDDERLTFHPELWNENPADYKTRKLDDRLQQVWFAGMHSNLGGGYPEDSLSGVSLNWMMDKAEREGLIFLKPERDMLRQSASVNGKMYYSRQGLGGFYRYMPRKIKDLTHNDVDNENNRVIIDTPKIHESVFIRIKNRVDGYAPIGLPEKYDVVPANGSHLILEGPHIESQGQVQDRVNRQRKVWNRVWWKRIVYFTTVAIFALLAAFPLYRPEEPKYNGLYIVSAALGQVGALLPGFLSRWVEAFQSHPALFLLIAGAFCVMLFLASSLQSKIFNSMREIFDTPAQAGGRIAEPTAGALYQLRSNSAIRKFFKWMKEKMIPWIILVIVAILILRFVLMLIDSSGTFFTPATGANTGSFHSNNPLWASGFNVEKGKRYRIKMSINGDGQDEWKDNEISGFSVNGFGTEHMSFPMYLAIPIRRNITEPWFKPIARIGRYGTDEYPLNPAKGSASDDNTLIAEITARSTGELYLYVNDAVLPGPAAWQIFYKNNKGYADVKIESLD